MFLTARGFSGHRLFISAFIQVIGHISALDASQSTPASCGASSNFSWFLRSPPIYFRVYSSYRSHFLLSTPLILLQHLEACFLTARGFSGHRLFISAFIELVINHIFCSRHLSFYYSICFLTARGSAYFAAFVIASKITPRHLLKHTT